MPTLDQHQRPSVALTNYSTSLMLLTVRGAAGALQKTSALEHYAEAFSGIASRADGYLPAANLDAKADSVTAPGSFLGSLKHCILSNERFVNADRGLEKFTGLIGELVRFEWDSPVARLFLAEVLSTLDRLCWTRSEASSNTLAWLTRTAVSRHNPYAISQPKLWDSRPALSEKMDSRDHTKAGLGNHESPKVVSPRGAARIGRSLQ